jgi:hypothetical protein
MDVGNGLTYQFKNNMLLRNSFKVFKKTYLS